jgi:hypothetical protein
METRNLKILQIREKLFGSITNPISPEELFQNNTLRPILKFQNDLLMELFIVYATKNKNVFFFVYRKKEYLY